MNLVYMIMVDIDNLGQGISEPHSYEVYIDEDKAQEVAFNLNMNSTSRWITYCVEELEVVG